MTKLVTCRLDESLLEKIDRLAASQKYLTRSRVIVALLTAMVDCTERGNLWRVLNSFSPYMDGIVINISKKEKKS